jgi:hypothetical protein
MTLSFCTLRVEFSRYVFNKRLRSDLPKSSTLETILSFISSSKPHVDMKNRRTTVAKRRHLCVSQALIGRPQPPVLFRGLLPGVRLFLFPAQPHSISTQLPLDNPAKSPVLLPSEVTFETSAIAVHAVPRQFCRAKAKLFSKPTVLAPIL